MRTLCRTCGKPVDNPFRVRDGRGKVIMGCVASDHDGHLVEPSESASWHGRKEARTIRRGNLKYWDR